MLDAVFGNVKVIVGTHGGNVVFSLVEFASKGEKSSYKKWPKPFDALYEQIESYFSTGNADFGIFELDFNGLSFIQKRVYTALRKNVTTGKVTTYKSLAQMAGIPRGARAVGRVLARNPFILLVP